MKKWIPIIALTVIAAIPIACGKDSDETPGTFSWTYNGTTYTATMNEARVTYDLTPFLIRGIIGTNFITSFSQQVYFSIGSFAPGSYTIGTAGRIGHYIDAMGNDYGLSGTLTITAYSNNRISGDFSCTAGGSPTPVINGSFSNVIVYP